MKKNTIDYISRILSVGFKQLFILAITYLAGILLYDYKFGYFSYIMAFLTIASVLADFGLSVAVVKYVAYDPTKRNVGLILFNGFVITVVTTLIATVITMILRAVRYIDIDTASMLILLTSVFTMSLTNVVDGILRGQKKYLPGAISTILTTLITIPLAYYMIQTYEVYGGLLSYAFYWFCNLISLLFIARPSFVIEIEKKIFFRLSKYAFLFGISSISYSLFSRYVIIVLGNMGDWNSVSLYELFSKIMLIFTFPFTIYGQILAPHYASSKIVSDKKILYRDTIKYTRNMTWVSFGVCFIYYFASYFVKLFMKPYADLPEYGLMQISTCALLFVYTWTNLIDVGIIVPSGYASIMTYTYPVIAVVSLILLPWSAQIGLVPMLVSVIVLQIIMALSVRLIYIFKLRKLLHTSK